MNDEARSKIMGAQPDVASSGESPWVIPSLACADWPDPGPRPLQGYFWRLPKYKAAGGCLRLNLVPVGCAFFLRRRFALAGSLVARLAVVGWEGSMWILGDGLDLSGAPGDVAGGSGQG